MLIVCKVVNWSLKLAFVIFLSILCKFLNKSSKQSLQIAKFDEVIISFIFKWLTDNIVLCNISENNSDGSVIQDLTLTLDSNGHVITSTATPVDLDQRYIQIGGISGFVETTGDEMTGKLTISSGGLEVTGSTDIKGQVSINSAGTNKVLDLRSTDEFATIYLSDDTTGPGAKGEAIRRHRDSLILRSNDNTTLIISGSNVGINDDTPEETLTVAGTAKVTGLVTGKAFRTISSNTDFSLIIG